MSKLFFGGVFYQPSTIGGIRKFRKTKYLIITSVRSLKRYGI